MIKLERMIKYGIKSLTHRATGVGLTLTRRCNLNCKYCNVIKSTNKKELSVGEWKKIIDIFVKNKHIHFVFTGGEPLLYGGVYELINYASQKALVSLITNTKLLDEGNIRKLKNLDFLTVSVDNLVPDGISNKCISKKLDLIKKYSAKYNFSVEVISTIHSKNVMQIPKIVRMASKNNFNFLISLIHSDKGKYEFRGYTPNLEFKKRETWKLKHLQKELIKMKRNGYRIGECEDFIKDMADYASKRYKIKCKAGDKYFQVNNDGFLMACKDSPPSKVHALHFKNYNTMRKEVQKNIIPGCNCFYNCYYNSNLSVWSKLMHLRDQIVHNI